TRGSPLWSVGSACSWRVSVMSTHLSYRGESLHVQVDHHGEQQHDAKEGLEPVGVPAGIDDAEAGHAEDECADGHPPRVAVAAGQQCSAHYCGDDVEELIPHAVAGLQRVEPVQVVHAGEPAEEGHRHKKSDLDPSHRHADSTSAGRVATN